MKAELEGCVKEMDAVMEEKILGKCGFTAVPALHTLKVIAVFNKDWLAWKKNEVQILNETFYY